MLLALGTVVLMFEYSKHYRCSPELLGFLVGSRLRLHLCKSTCAYCVIAFLEYSL